MSSSPAPRPSVPSSGLSLWLVAYFALVASFGPHLGFARTFAGLAAVAWVLRHLGHDSDRYCPQEVAIVLAGTAAGLALGVLPEALRGLCALACLIGEWCTTRPTPRRQVPPPSGWQRALLGLVGWTVFAAVLGS